MNVTDIATWLSTSAAAVGAGTAGWQLFLLRKQEVDRGELELKGVAVAWNPQTPPNHGRDDIWIYKIHASNPGQYPISDVNVELRFPVDVERLRDTGEFDPPSRTVRIGAPTILGGDKRKWARTLRIRPNQRESLRRITATIDFLTVDGQRITNCWPVSETS